MSNNQVAKFFINLDVKRTCNDPEMEAKKFSDSVISNSKNRISVLVFTGTKENGVRAFRDAGLTASPDSALKRKKKLTDAQDLGLDPKTKETLEKHLDVRYIMPSHMPQYLRIDKDVKDALIKLSHMIK